MKLEIRPFTPELAGDYYDFHENKAFSDHAEWSHCYCIAFCTTKADDREISAEAKQNGNNRGALHRALRIKAEKCISGGALHGYMAYVDGVAAGWVNTDDKRAYTRFDFDEGINGFIKSSSGGRVKAITCFCIAPMYRGKGVATTLLERVVADAESECYDAVEGYPRILGKREEFDYTGPERLYENAGFATVAKNEKVIVMRKELRD